ncbi:MAG: hypothetical protein P8J79_12005 [Halioglobus sp.]|nr:hypothetical protein [Halioglobus sp.]
MPVGGSEAAVINAWLAQNQPEAGAPALGRLARAMGSAEFAVRSETITALAQPCRFFLLQGVQALYATLNNADRAAVDEMLRAGGMWDILTTTLHRRITRAGNLELRE